MPSSPRMMTRLNRALRIARNPNRARFKSRTGHVMNVKSADPIAARTAKNEPAKANPAPGPM